MSDRLLARRNIERNIPATESRLPVRETPQKGGYGTGKKEAGFRISLDQLVDRIRELPALPHISLRVIKMAESVLVPPRELAELIAQDPGFAMRVLKLANSACYGLPRAVGTLTDAVMLLGGHIIRELAFIASTQDVLAGPLPGYEMEAGELWHHALACGMACEMLAEATKYRDREEAFIAGLLHDVGKVALGTFVKEALPVIQQYAEQVQCDFCTAERVVLGFDSAEVGGRIAQRWNLPAPLVQAIGQHQQPEATVPLMPLVAIVHVANSLCLMAGVGLGSDGLRMTLSSAALEALHLSDEKIEAILSRLTEQMAEAQLLFQIADMSL